MCFCSSGCSKILEIVFEYYFNFFLKNNGSLFCLILPMHVSALGYHVSSPFFHARVNACL